MTVKERLIEYIKNMGMSLREFCREVGLSETYVSSMRSSIQPDKLMLITAKFPDLNPTWLMTREDEMIRGTDTLPAIEREKFIDIDALSYLVADYKVSADWLLRGKGGMFRA